MFVNMKATEVEKMFEDKPSREPKPKVRKMRKQFKRPKFQGRNRREFVAVA